MLALASLCGALIWAHGAPGADHMAGDHQEGSSALGICLAVLQGGLALFVVGGATALLLRRLRRRRGATHRTPSRASIVPVPVPVPARAGPAILQVFLL